MFERITGNAGYVTAGGAKIGIISQWHITRSGIREDGTPILRFWASFSYINQMLMSARMRKSLYVQFKTKNGVETIPIIGWAEWHVSGNELILEDVVRDEATTKKEIIRVH